MVQKTMLGWFGELGYQVVYGPDIAVDDPTPERRDCKQVVLVERQMQGLHRINADLPVQANRLVVPLCSHERSG